MFEQGSQAPHTINGYTHNDGVGVYDIVLQVLVMHCMGPLLCHFLHAHTNNKINWMVTNKEFKYIN